MLTVESDLVVGEEKHEVVMIYDDTMGYSQ